MESDHTSQRRDPDPGTGVLVTLDPETAHHNLILSEDGRRVRCSPGTQSMPATPKRFKLLFAVLGKEEYSSGRHYWEVRLLEEGEWCVGAARESLDRKTLSLKSGVWALEWSNNKYIALNLSSAPLTLTERPKNLGVHLNYDMAQLSFYNAETMMLLCTFTISALNERIFPYFCVWGKTDLLLV
ncbi:butyrophilin subfamily 1 member A1-like [Lissotriton helveticus]